jgi:predicted MarR family transcription regulator|tara:strand:+ start:314 stop:847 length:534 start_codon:yes stop_codon:yes gene_type:complete
VLISLEGVMSPKSDLDTDAVIMENSQLMTQFEQALSVSKNAFEQWVVRCGAAAGMKGYSALELLVLHKVSGKERPKRIADICFSIKIEDTHLVSYALRKLAKAGYVQSRKQGKETFYSATPAGGEVIDRYKAVRRKYLIRSLSMLSSSEVDLEHLASILHALSGIYEQAARNVEYSL